MSVQVSCSTDGKVCDIQVSGKFQFVLGQEFRSAYDPIKTPGCLFRVQLEQTEYMDSSALGMLLLLREHAGTHGGKVRLCGPRPRIRHILEMARFDKIFAIDY